MQCDDGQIMNCLREMRAIYYIRKQGASVNMYQWLPCPDFPQEEVHCALFIILLKIFTCTTELVLFEFPRFVTALLLCRFVPESAVLCKISMFLFCKEEDPVRNLQVA